jgi:uncharacterized protein (TIGR00369 family)
MADAQPIHNEPIPGFDGLYGLQYTRVDGDGVDAQVEIEPKHHQPFGIVHGGVYAAMAESMASVGTFVGTGEDKFVAGMSNHTTFLRATREGTVRAQARPLHTGRTTWIWDVDITGGDGRPVAAARVTIAVREAR